MESGNHFKKHGSEVPFDAIVKKPIPASSTMINNMHPDPQILLALVRMKMPFGKYKDTLLCDLPVAYLEWFGKAGFPPGKLGILLETALEIKCNGLGDLLVTLKKMESGKS